MTDILLKVRVTPRARSDRLDAWDGEKLSVRVTAPPEKGKANEALLRLLAGALGLPVSSLRLVRGQASREKLVAVEGLAREELLLRLDRHLAERARG
jgi:hypothetical protein